MARDFNLASGVGSNFLQLTDYRRAVLELGVDEAIGQRVEPNRGAEVKSARYSRIRPVHGSRRSHEERLA
jgi:hypothetical protein